MVGRHIQILLFVLLTLLASTADAWRTIGKVNAMGELRVAVPGHLEFDHFEQISGLAETLDVRLKLEVANDPEQQLADLRVDIAVIPQADGRLRWVHRPADSVLAFKIATYRQRQALAIAVGGQRNDFSRPLSPYDDLAREYGRYFGFEWKLLVAIMFAESRFDPQAVSRSGAFGLMQLKPIALKQVGMRDARTPRDNVLAGVRYLQWVHQQMEDRLDPAERIWMTLAAYNGGIRHLRDARKLARAAGKNPDRWAGNVEWAIDQLGQERDDLDSDQVIGYVAKIRSRLKAYMAPSNSSGAGVLASVAPP